MLIPYYSKQENREKLLRVLETWKNTPFRHGACAKGGGVDCVMFTMAVFVDMGFTTLPKNFKSIVTDPYPRDSHTIPGNELFIQTFWDNLKYKRPGFELHGFPITEPLLFGDLMIIKTETSRVPNHSAFYLENNSMIHSESIGNVGVVTTLVDSKVMSSLIYILRVFIED